MVFVNTVDVLGDNALVDSIIDGTIKEFRDENVTIIGTFAFAVKDKLTLVDVPNVANIGANAFLWTDALKTLILRKNSVCNLEATNALTGTQFYYNRGNIYVPDNLVDSYKSATNWSTFAAVITPLSELEE